MIAVELYTEQMPVVLRRFSETVGESHWVKRAALIRSDISGRPFLRDYLIEDNAIVFALDACTSLLAATGTIPREHTVNRSLYPAFRFAAQTLSIIDGASPDQARRLVRRIHGAFKNPEELRAIELELSIATHFVKRGHEITWPEMEESGTYDLFVKDLGPRGLEIECKSVSRDKGRKIHRLEARLFFELVRERLEHVANRLRSGLAVVLTVKERLPTKGSDLVALADFSAKGVLAGKDARHGDIAELRLSDFDISAYPELGPEMTATVRAHVDVITRTNDRQVMIMGRRTGGALVFAVQSRREDTLLRYVFDTAGIAARRQLSKDRAGLVLVGFEDLSPSQLVETAKQDSDPAQPPTALRIAVSEFLQKESMSHLIGVAFFSHGVLTKRAQSIVTDEGVAYYFPRTESFYWHEDYRALFTG